MRTAPSIEPLNTPATVHVVRCFKGLSPSADVEVLYDGILPSAGFAGGTVPLVLERGDYALFFLKPHGKEFAPVDVKYASKRYCGSPHRPTSIIDPLQLMEPELIAGLKDSSRDLVLTNIRLLGLMEGVAFDYRAEARCKVERPTRMCLRMGSSDAAWGSKGTRGNPECEVGGRFSDRGRMNPPPSRKSATWTTTTANSSSHSEFKGISNDGEMPNRHFLVKKERELVIRPDSYN